LSEAGGNIKVNVGGNIKLVTKFGSRRCGGGEREDCGKMVKEKLNIVWEINVKRIWGDIKMVKAYLLWSMDGLAAAPHCGIVGEHIILPFNSPTASLQLLTPAHQKSQPSSLSIITFFHPFDS